MNTAIHIILGSLLAILAGGYLGKRSMDTLIDSNLKGALSRLKAAGAVEILLIFLAIIMKGERAEFIAVAALFPIFVAAGFFLPLLLALWSVPKADYSGEVIKGLVFDENRNETGYDLYLPENREKKTYPLILYVHGGGFSGGSKKDGDRWCRYLAKKGMVTATMDYTLADGKHDTSLTLMADEIKDCVAAIKEKCAALDITINEMAITGGSAGGCLAMLYAYKYREESPIPIKFVFQQTGPAYFDPVIWGTVNYNTFHKAAFSSMMTGVKLTEEMVERGEHYPLIEAISPSCYVDENTVPTLCAYGPRDKMVPVQVKYYLFDAFERNHVTYDFVEYPHSNHGMYDDPKANRVFLRKVDEYINKYFGR